MAGLVDLRTAYGWGEAVVVSELPEETASVQVRTALGTTYPATLDGPTATVAGLPVGTHALEACSATGEILAEEFFGVRRQRGDDPVMGFVTSFDEASRPAVLEWLTRLRCTVVQVYDWMASYSSPLPEGRDYQDPLGRSLDRPALERLVTGIRDLGAVAQAYAPVCAADALLADAHPEWRLFRNDGAPQSLGDLLEIMDPGNTEWQRHWIEHYGAAADALGFDGFHLDTYGYPRNALSLADSPVDVTAGYGRFVEAVRAARPLDILSFNQVNGVPRGFRTTPPPSFRYVEVWPPNDRWRHFEGLLDRSRSPNSWQGDTLAVYPPVWDGERGAALRTAVLSEAVATTLGANVLVWGDATGVLNRPYYVDHERLDEDEANVAVAWRRQALRCRDLFKRGVDTSWYELGDENASVVVSWDGPTAPEPVGGSLYARVVRENDLVSVSLLDLTGSPDGSWMSSSARGWCTGARVEVLVDAPNRWRAEVSVHGRDEGRFTLVEAGVSVMREGAGLAITVPLIEGWSILRLVRGSVA